jgi:hypothetical protein
MLLYAATCAAALWLVSRFLTRIPATWGFAIALLPFLVTGRAMVTGSHFGPLNLAYAVSPLSAGGGPAVHREYGNGFLSDVAFQILPFQAAVRNDLRAGRAPLLNPAILCGDVLLGAAQPAPFHPSTVIGSLLPLATARTLAASLALFLEVLGVFVFLRDVDLSPLAALFGGAVWMLSLHSLFWVGWPVAQTFATLPLLCAGFRRIARGCAGGFGTAVAALVLALLGGHPESAFHVAAVAGAYFAWEVARSPGRVRAMLLAVGAGLLAAALAAPALLPFVDVIPQTREGRARTGAALGKTSNSGAESARSAVGMVFPDAYGRWLRPRSSSAPSFDSATAGSVGGIALVLALCGLTATKREKWAFAILAALTLAVAVGTPGAADLVNRLPVFRWALNNRLAGATAFFVAALAAIGLDEMIRADRGFGRWLFLTALAACVTVVLRRSALARRGVDPAAFTRAGMLFVGGILLLWLLHAATRSRTALFGPGAMLLFLSFRSAETPRLYPTFPLAAFYPPISELAGLPADGEPFRIAGLGDAFVPNQSALYGLEDVRGFEPIVNARLVETFPLWCTPQELWFNRVDDPSRPFLGYLNARFALAAPSAPIPPAWVERARGRSLAIFENPAVLPRAFAPERIRFVAPGTAAVTEMKQYTNFRGMAWIEARNELPREIANGPAAVATREDGPDLDLRIHASAPSWIVVSETNWKGWRAREGKIRYPIVFANHAFVGFRVGAGEHHVRLEYRPASYYRGFGVSALGGAILLIAAIRRREVSR